MRNLAALMGKKETPGRVAIERAAVAIFLAANGNEPDAITVARRRWPDDELAVAVLERAAVGAASTTTAGWAAELVQGAFGEFMGSLVPISAAARIIELGLRVEAPPAAAEFTAPARATALNGLPWVGEGAPIPVRAYSFAGVKLKPKKFATISVFSRELSKRSNIGTVLTQLLREDAAYSLDAGYFSTTAGDATTHAGLLAGATEVPASSAGGQIAFEEDMEALLTAIASGSSGQVVYVTGTVAAEMVKVRFPDFWRESVVLPSPAVPNTRFIAADAGALVHSFGGDPEIDTSTSGTLHLSDTPSHISAAGSPNTIAAPVVSLYQNNLQAMRLIGDMAFGQRRSGAVAYVDDFDWSRSAVGAG